jgi:cell division transport system permease protein
MQITQAKGVWYDKVEVAVYMCPNGSSPSSNCTGDEATQSDIDKLQDTIKTELASDVDAVYIESKDDAYAEFIKKYPGGVVNGQTLTPDDMQVSLRIKLKNPEKYKTVAEVLTGRPGVEEVTDQKQIFDPIFTALNKLTVITVALAVLMMLTAILLIQTTIRLSASTRRKEVEIMRLVGASNAFIRTPFILEGVLSSILGAGGACAALALFVQYFIQGWLAPSVRWMDFIDIKSAAIISPLLIVIAALLATFSSTFSLKKYMKV